MDEKIKKLISGMLLLEIESAKLINLYKIYQDLIKKIPKYKFGKGGKIYITANPVSA